VNEPGAKPDVEFFIGELETISREQDNRYNSLTKRIAALEAKKGSSEFDVQELLGTLFLVMAVLQIVPLVLDLVKQWKSSSSSQLSE
jgi:hypothetical protein